MIDIVPMTMLSPVDRHNRLLDYRDNRVPFPPESVAFWCFILSLQEQLGVKGDFLEMGVEHGGTAFLTMLSAAHAGAHQTLIDLKTSPRFSETFERVTPEMKAATTFLETSTFSPNLDDVAAKRYRFIHIDASHDYEGVKKDALRFGGSIQDDGVLCFDDVFEIRWPGVTQAVFEAIPQIGVEPIAFVNRKLYCAKAGMASTYRKAIIENVDALEPFGSARHWTTYFLDSECVTIKMAMNPKVTREPL